MSKQTADDRRRARRERACCMRNRGAPSWRRRNSAISRNEYFRVLFETGGTISRIHDCLIRRSGWPFMRTRPCTFGPRRRQWKYAPCRCHEGGVGMPARPRARDGHGCIFRHIPNLQVITKLRFPTRKTRPSVKSVITLALRKNAPDGNRCREGDAYSAQIRQSRCHCAGISFV